jgi:hypothetical protein
MPLNKLLKIAGAAALVCAVLLGLAACAPKAEPQPAVPDETSLPEVEVTPEPSSEPPEENFEYVPFVAYVGWTDFLNVLPSCDNGTIINETIMLSSVRHLPVFCVGSAAELEELKASLGEFLQFDFGYDEAPSFNDITEHCDDAFFAEKSLVFAWVESGSGSYRFGLTGVEREDGVFRIYADKINDPEVGTDDMAGWFVGAEVPKAALEGFPELDAMYGGPME